MTLDLTDSTPLEGATYGDLKRAIKKFMAVEAIDSVDEFMTNDEALEYLAQTFFLEMLGVRGEGVE